VRQADQRACQEDPQHINLEAIQRNECGKAQEGGKPIHFEEFPRRPDDGASEDDGEVQDHPYDRCGYA
jgi:hypothetical protein